MTHSITNKPKLLTRVRRIKGQVEGLEKQLLAEGDCSKVLQQIAAVRGAINGLMTEILEHHSRDHLAGDNLEPLQRDADVEQVISVLRSYLKS